MAVIFPQNPTPGQVYLPPGSSIGYTWTGTFWDKGVVAFTSTGSLEIRVGFVPGNAVSGSVSSAVTSSYTQDGNFFTTAARVGMLNTEVVLDNIRARISATGNRSIQLATVDGITTVDGMQPGGVNSVNQVTRVEGLSINTTHSYIDAPTHMANPGDSQVFTFIDRNAGACYRVTGLVSEGYNQNLISIEKLV